MRRLTRTRSKFGLREAAAAAAAAEQDPEPDWYILSKLPMFYHTENVFYRLRPPPRFSHLLVAETFTPMADYLSTTSRPPSITAFTSALVLFHFPANQAFFLYSAYTSNTYLLPPVPQGVGFPALHPGHNIGLAEDPASADCRKDHFLVAQISKLSKAKRYEVLTFRSLQGAWELHTLPAAQEHWPWNTDGVLFHDGCFWWVDARHGNILVYNPFEGDGNRPSSVRIITLGVPCINLSVSPRVVKGLRLLRVSGGAVRFVEIEGVDINVAEQEQQDPTLPNYVDGDDARIVLRTFIGSAVSHYSDWSFDFTVPLKELWARGKNAGLPYGEVPRLAFLHPTRAHIIYLFFKDTMLAAFDLHKRVVISYSECRLREDGDADFQTSEFVDSVVLPDFYYAPTRSCAGMCGWGLPASYGSKFNCDGSCTFTLPAAATYGPRKIGQPKITPLPAAALGSHEPSIPSSSLHLVPDPELTPSATADVDVETEVAAAGAPKRRGRSASTATAAWTSTCPQTTSSSSSPRVRAGGSGGV